MEDKEHYIRVPMEKKEYYDTEVIVSLLKKMNEGKGMVALQIGEDHVMLPINDMKDFKSFCKIAKLMIEKPEEKLVEDFKKGLEDLKQGKFRRIR